MTNDVRLDRYYLKSAVDDAINIVMLAAGHNLRKILNKFRLYQGYEGIKDVLSNA